jgi:hypothetical protein
MDQMLRGQDGWQEAIASALARARHPIAVDPRFSPRIRSGVTPSRAAMPAARAASTLLLVHPGTDGELVVPLTLRHAELRAAVYHYAGQHIWGATARTLAMFATVLADATAG